MIKQGYEDFKRHKADREINDRKVEVLKEGKMKTMKSEVNPFFLGKSLDFRTVPINI